MHYSAPMHPVQRQSDPKALAATFMALFLWSMGPNVIRYLSGHFDPYSQNFWRYAAAGLFCAPQIIFCLSRRRMNHRLWLYALVPLIGNVGMQTCWACALYRVEPGFASLLTKVSILWIALFSFLLFADERYLFRSGRFWVGLILSLMGLAGVIGFSEGFSASGSVSGMILTQLAGLGWAVYTISSRKVTAIVGPGLTFAVLSIYTTIALGVLAFLFGQPMAIVDVSWPIVLLLIASGISAIAIAHTLFIFAIGRIGTLIPSLIILSSPLWVFVISWFVFSERLTIGQMISGLVLLAGGALSTLSRQRP